MNKIHWLTMPPERGIELRTGCGLVGFLARRGSTELETVRGTRFEITKDVLQITCLRCKASRNRP